MKKSNLFRVAISILILWSFSILGCTEQAEKEEDNELFEFMSAYDEHCSYEYSGSILVAKGDEILLNESYGVANKKEEIQNSVDTIFPIGSITKSFTATAVLQLHEKGLLNINDPVSKYIDTLDRGDDITIRQLLSHTSGLCRDGKFSMHQNVTLDENIEFINKNKVAFEPGTGFSYSNASYIVLAAIIEEVSGETYNKYIEDNIFVPLGMENSRCGTDNSYAESQSIGYEIGPDGATKLSIYDFSSITGSGNVYSTIGDLYKFERSLSSKALLTEQSLDEMFKSQSSDSDNGTGYGFGWQTSEKYGHMKMYHGGCIGNGGYNSLIIKYPDEDYVLIFLTNNADTTALNAVSQSLEAILFNEEYIMPERMIPVKVKSSILERYAGAYCFGEGIDIPVFYENNKLYSMADDGNRYELIPISKTEFYYENHECTRGEFIVDEDSDEITFRIQSKTFVIEGQKVGS